MVHKLRTLIFDFFQTFVRFNQGSRLRAAALAFYALLSVFPLLVLLLTGANAIWGDATVNEWAQRLTQRFFPGDLPTTIVSGISAIVQSEQSLNVIALVGLIWGASSFFSNLMLSLDLAFTPEIKNRPMWRKRVSASLMIATLAVLLGLTIIVSYSLRLTARSLVENPGAIMRVFSLVVPLVLDTFILSLLFRYVPRTKIPWRAILIGAIFGAIGFETSRTLFAWYLENLATYDAVYGSLGAIIATLMWVYLSLAILLYSAELSATYAEKTRKHLSQKLADKD